MIAQPADKGVLTYLQQERQRIVALMVNGEGPPSRDLLRELADLQGVIAAFEAVFPSKLFPNVARVAPSADIWPWAV